MPWPALRYSLFDDQMAAGLRMKIVEEFIAAGIERPDKDGNLLAGSDDFLAMELTAFEFRRGLVLVADDAA